MSNKIRSKIFLFFGVIVFVVVFSSTAFSQQSGCFIMELYAGSKLPSVKGATIDNIEVTKDKTIVTICPNNTASRSTQQQTVYPTSEEIARQQQAEREEEIRQRKLAAEERRRSIAEEKARNGGGAGDRDSPAQKREIRGL